MRRREFIAGLGGAAAWPFAARAQQPSMPVIGYVGAQSAQSWASRVHAFRQGLRETGFVEGKNVMIEFRWAEDRFDRYPALIADLVRRKVAVIATPGATPAIVAAKAATTTIPIVFLTAADPVQAGLVASLNRPGGNLTGVTALSLELSSKQLELLHEFAPAARSMALLVNPTSAVLAETQSKDLPATARKLGLGLHILHASAEREFEDVFATITKLGIGGLIIGGETVFTTGSKELAALALRNHVPAIYQFREFAAAGGLMSYGASLSDAHRRAGVYTGRILKGEKPADLPVEQVAKFELVVNLKTAKSFDLDPPPALLARADEVIE
jgi:putative tryptophan/tyrosine transport system substrate-binding protein